MALFYYKGSSESGIPFGLLVKNKGEEMSGKTWSDFFFSSLYLMYTYPDRGHFCIAYLIRRRKEIKMKKYGGRKMITNGERKGRLGESTR